MASTEQVVGLVRLNNRYNRVHSIGVGEGVSAALVEGVAKFGKGRSMFVSDKEELSGKVISFLEQTLSPVVDNIRFT